MSDQGFADHLQHIAAAVSGSQNSFVMREDNFRRIDELISARLKTANLTAEADRNWAAERSHEVAVTVDQGRRLLPGEIDDTADIPAPVALPTSAAAADPRTGLQAALNKAQAEVDGIRDGGQRLLGWRGRRSAILRAILILLLVLLIVLGLLWIWRSFQTSVAESAVTQTAVASAVVTTQTAVSLKATQEAEQSVTIIGTEATSEANGEILSPVDSATPTLTLPPPTRTPRPPPTLGPTPTSLPPGAIVCPGAFPTRLTVGGRARVINYQLNVRAGPGTHHNIVRRLDPGRTMDVLDGPVCDNGQLWYYILSEEIVPRDGSASYRAEGWLVEESGEIYYLEPLQ